MADVDRYFVKSLAKGLAVFKAMAAANRPLTLSELAKAVGQNTTTTTRLCHTLTELGYLARDRQLRYHLTPRVLTLGHAVVSSLDWLEVAQHHLQNLFSQAQETVSMATRDGAEMLYVARIRREKYLPFDIRIGTKLPLHCTAMGKVLLAFNAPEVTESIMQGMDYRKLTPRTVENSQALRRRLEAARKNGYAVNDEELTVGNRAVGVPVLGEDGYALAAVHLAAPTKRYTMEALIERFVPLLQKTAAEISSDWQQLEIPVTREMLEGGVTNSLTSKRS